MAVQENPHLYDAPDFLRLVEAWLGESGFFFSGHTAAENDVFLGYLGLVSKLSKRDVSGILQDVGEMYRDTPRNSLLDALFAELTEGATSDTGKDHFFKEAMQTWPKGLGRHSSTNVLDYHISGHFDYLLDTGLSISILLVDL